MSNITYLYRNISGEGKQEIANDFCPSDYGLKDGSGGHGCTGANSSPVKCKECWDNATKEEAV